MLHVLPQLYLFYFISLSKALMYVPINYQKGGIESTSAPWVILVINVNISLVGLIFSSSIFPKVQQRRGMDKRMWNPFKKLRTKIGKS